jgi:hypothetical protein
MLENNVSSITERRGVEIFQQNGETPPFRNFLRL